MGFDCRICGCCCMYLGDYIVIEEQTGPYTFSCSSVSTGTGFSATIDPDKRVFFDDQTFPGTHPSACRFLRPLGDGRIGCTIHTDSPAQCKHYRCVILRISSPDGTEIGRVTGTGALHSSDMNLRSLFEAITAGTPPTTPEEEETVRAGLAAAGYQVE